MPNPFNKITKSTDSQKSRSSHILDSINKDIFTNKIKSEIYDKTPCINHISYLYKSEFSKITTLLSFYTHLKININAPQFREKGNEFIRKFFIDHLFHLIYDTNTNANRPILVFPVIIACSPYCPPKSLYEDFMNLYSIIHDITSRCRPLRELFKSYQMKFPKIKLDIIPYSFNNTNYYDDPILYMSNYNKPNHQITATCFGAAHTDTANYFRMIQQKFVIEKILVNNKILAPSSYEPISMFNDAF